MYKIYSHSQLEQRICTVYLSKWIFSQKRKRPYPHTRTKWAVTVLDQNRKEYPPGRTGVYWPSTFLPLFRPAHVEASLQTFCSILRTELPQINQSSFHHHIRAFLKMSDLFIELTAPNGRKYKQPTGIFINNEFVKSKKGEKITSISPTYGPSSIDQAQY